MGGSVVYLYSHSGRANAGAQKLEWAWVAVGGSGSAHKCNLGGQCSECPKSPGILGVGELAWEAGRGVWGKSGTNIYNSLGSHPISAALGYVTLGWLLKLSLSLPQVLHL